MCLDWLIRKILLSDCIAREQDGRKRLKSRWEKHVHVDRGYSMLLSIG